MSPPEDGSRLYAYLECLKPGATHAIGQHVTGAGGAHGQGVDVAAFGGVIEGGERRRRVFVSIFLFRVLSRALVVLET